MLRVIDCRHGMLGMVFGASGRHLVSGVQHHRRRRRAQRDEQAKPPVDSTPINVPQARGDESGGDRRADARCESLPGGQISRVAALQLRYGKRFQGFAEVEVMRRFAGDLEASKYSVAIVDRQICFDEQRI